MSPSTSTFAPESSLSVAGQQWSSTASQGFEEEALLSSTIDTTDSWDSAVEAYDVQEIEIVYPHEDYDSMLRSAPLTPDLTWDSQPSTGTDFADEHLKSVFEDWDDAVPSTSNLNADNIPHIQVVEEDGTQVLLIPAESDFYSEHEYSKEPIQLTFPDLPEVPSNPTIIIARGNDITEAASDVGALPISTPTAAPESPYKSPDTSSLFKGENTAGIMLFVDTTLLSSSWGGNNTAISTPSYFSPLLARSGIEESTWVPKDTPTYMLDVPLDCHCSASPIEQWN